MDTPGQNDAFDRELRRTLAAGGGTAPGAHLDAELAAAWMDRQLQGPSALAIEAHLAGCADCQALLATLARIAPEPAAAGHAPGWWQRLRAGWIVPATAAAAAALVIWVALPEQRAGAPPSQRAATNEVAAPPDSSPKTEQAADPAAERSAAMPSIAPPGAREADEQKNRVALAAPPPPPPPSATAPVPAPVPAPAAPGAAAEEFERRTRADAAAPPPESLRDSVTVERPSASAEARAKEGIATAGEPAARAGGAAGAAGARRQEAAAAPPQDRFAADSLGRVASLRAANALTIAAPDGARWRRTGSLFEFAPRAGAAFTAVTLPVAGEAIVAGASPGGTVCWLVGDGGLVLVSVDGVRFVRVAPPAATGLAAVTATDARTAVVTALDGRRFRTTDGGANWRQP